MKVAVVGAGKMGLPLACQFAHRGAEVFACDVNAELVAVINRGEAPFEEPGLAERLGPAVAKGNLRATTDTARAASECEVVVVIVPALLTADNDVDPSILQAVCKQLAGSLKNGALVCFETTLPVGGTRHLLLPVLEEKGLRAGVDFDLAFSPERVKSGSVFRNLTVNPKVAGGFSPEAAARAAAFYQEFLGAPVMNVGTLEAAEMVKLAGMLYRDVNIALANELSRYGEAVGVDVNSLRDAINCDGEANLLISGIGVGGHCTPVYPYFLIRDAERRGVHATLAERSRAINDGQAAHAIDQLERAFAKVKDRRVLMLGLAFRAGVKEDTLSTAYLLHQTLRARGAKVLLHDPLFSDEELRSRGFEPGRLEDRPEVVILQAAHAQYRDLDFAAFGVRAVVDGRNLYDADKIRAQGLVYVGIGRAAPAAALEPIPIARPLLGGDEAEAAARVIRSGWVLQGPEVAALEREFSDFTGAAHSCAVSSGTAALHLALLALGVGPGDEVITVSHSYVATANSIRLCGATPVFVDIDDTYNLEPAQIKITARTKAILGVHQMGMPCDLSRILSHGIPVIEDAACAIGSEIEFACGGQSNVTGPEWQRIGRPHGVMATFSFHPRKLLTTGDGGMVTTNDAALDRKVRLLRQHGMLKSDGPAEVVAFNYRLTDIQAAIARRQLRRLPSMLAERRSQAERYRLLLRDLAVELPREPAWARSNWQSFCTRVADRDRILRGLAERDISARGGIMNAHEQPAYTPQSLPASEAATRHGLILPLFPGMSEAQQERVAAALRELL